MKKRVIRLTESELKRYINKVVSEQMINKSQPTVDPTKTSVKLGDTTQKTDAMAAIRGKNVQMYYDQGKTNKAYIIKVESQGHEKATDGKTLFLRVQDLTKMNTNTGEFLRNDDKGCVKIIHTCGNGGFVAMGEGDYQLKSLYNPEFMKVVEDITGCKQFKMNTNPDFASNGGTKPTDFA